MITSRIIGRDGQQLKVNGEGEISVTVHTHPPLDETFESLPFRAYFLDDAGSNDMRVNGTTTPNSFSISADGDYDYFIKTISVKLADAGMSFSEFGNLTALTNGLEFSWISQKEGTLIVHEGIKDNIEFFRLSDQTPTIIDLSGGGADSITVMIDLTKIFGTPWGLRLTKGTTEKLSFIVRDNLGTGIDEFNIIGYGIKI